MACCMGAECQSVLPQARFLLLEPTELEREGFCEDWGPGLAFHQGETCFRQENCVFDCAQICVDGNNTAADSRDTISPVIGTAPNGRCLYDMPWDPVGGFRAHPLSLGHTALDVIPSLFGVL